jgi:hypothetical protein
VWMANTRSRSPRTKAIHESRYFLRMWLASCSK